MQTIAWLSIAEPKHCKVPACLLQNARIHADPSIRLRLWSWPDISVSTFKRLLNMYATTSSLQTRNGDFIRLGEELLPITQTSKHLVQ
jgi:hypothetical protein